MMVRLLPIRIGARVRTRCGYPYELPAGLAADQEVLVQGPPEARCQSKYRVGNRWVPEDHPEVVARLASFVTEDR